MQGELNHTISVLIPQAIETILEKYQEIFVEEDDGGDKASA